MTTIHTIKMPDIGEGIAEVELVEWFVDVGDTVSEDQVLADVMTDKASVEIPSPVAGVVQRLGGKVGDVMAVGAELITIDTAAEPAAHDPQKVDVAAAVQVPPVTDRTPPSTPTENKDTVVSVPSSADTGKVLASPSVRHRARQLNLDLTKLGKASAEIISHQDLDAYLLKNQVKTPGEAPKRGPAGIEQIPVVGMRRQIAQKMQQSKHQIPHFSYVESVDMTALERLRQQLNADARDDDPHLTLLPFIIRAMVLAIAEVPAVNARFDDTAEVIHQFSEVHIGLATQTRQGLMVPVVRNAQTLDIWQCATEIAYVSNAARQGRARREQLSGASITVTSLGALGGIVSTPIINYPEVAIVGVNKMQDEVIVEGGQMVIRKMMNLSSSFDHRVVDGMQAAEFIQLVRKRLETPALLFIPPS